MAEAAASQPGLRHARPMPSHSGLPFMAIVVCTLAVLNGFVWFFFCRRKRRRAMTSGFQKFFSTDKSSKGTAFDPAFIFTFSSGADIPLVPLSVRRRTSQIRTGIDSHFASEFASAFSLLDQIAQRHNSQALRSVSVSAFE